MQIALPTSLSFGGADRDSFMSVLPVPGRRHSSGLVCMEPLRPFGLFCVRYLGWLGSFVQFDLGLFAVLMSMPG